MNIQDDEHLASQVQDLHEVQTHTEFQGWRSSFLERFEGFLQDEECKIAYDTYKMFGRRVLKLIKLILETKAVLGEMNVKTRKRLTDLSEQIAVVTDQQELLIPITKRQEESYGYSQHHFGAVLVRDNFSEYRRLVFCANILEKFATKLEGVVNRQVLTVYMTFRPKLQIFCEVLADLGLNRAMRKSHELEPLTEGDFYGLSDLPDIERVGRRRQTKAPPKDSSGEEAKKQANHVRLSQTWESESSKDTPPCAKRRTYESPSYAKKQPVSLKLGPQISLDNYTGPPKKKINVVKRAWRRKKPNMVRQPSTDESAYDSYDEMSLDEYSVYVEDDFLSDSEYEYEFEYEEMNYSYESLEPELADVEASPVTPRTCNTLKPRPGRGIDEPYTSPGAPCMPNRLNQYEASADLRCPSLVNDDDDGYADDESEGHSEHRRPRTLRGKSLVEDAHASPSHEYSERSRPGTVRGKSFVEEAPVSPRQFSECSRPKKLRGKSTVGGSDEPISPRQYSECSRPKTIRGKSFIEDGPGPSSHQYAERSRPSTPRGKSIVRDEPASSSAVYSERSRPSSLRGKSFVSDQPAQSSTYGFEERCRPGTLRGKSFLGSDATPSSPNSRQHSQFRRPEKMRGMSFDDDEEVAQQMPQELPASKSPLKSSMKKSSLMQPSLASPIKVLMKPPAESCHSPKMNSRSKSEDFTRKAPVRRVSFDSDNDVYEDKQDLRRGAKRVPMKPPAEFSRPSLMRGKSFEQSEDNFGPAISQVTSTATPSQGEQYPERSRPSQWRGKSLVEAAPLPAMKVNGQQKEAESESAFPERARPAQWRGKSIVESPESSKQPIVRSNSPRSVDGDVTEATSPLRSRPSKWRGKSVLQQAEAPALQESLPVQVA